jgi:hypothetical protein
MSATDLHPLGPLARRGIADPLARELLAAWRNEAGAAARLLEFATGGRWPEPVRPFLSLMAHANIDAMLPPDHPVRPVLRAARLHESLRLSAIDEVAALVRDSLAAAGRQASFVGGYDIAQAYPDRTVRHVHTLRLWCPAKALDRTADLLQQAGLYLDQGLKPRSTVRLHHQNGCRIVLGTTLLPPVLGPRAERRLEQEIGGDGTATPAVRFARLVGIALGSPTYPATQFIVDAHFLLAAGQSLEPLAALTRDMGLELPAAALIEEAGWSPGPVGQTALRSNSVSSPVIRQMTRAAWRRSGRDIGAVLGAGRGAAQRLRIAQAVAALATAHMARRLRPSVQ